MSASMKRTGVKQKLWMRDAAARRAETMKQQRQARRDLTDHARRLAAGGGETTDTESDVEGAVTIRRPSHQRESESAMDIANDAAPCASMEELHHSKKKTREERVKKRRAHFAQQLMVPEWMVDVPWELNGKGSATGAGWYVVPRPEGKRCLVVTNSGVTIARTQSGSILKKFPSALPNGSRKTTTSSDSYCILDCIFHEPDGTFYVLDVMCWKGYLLYDCTTEFRWYWLRDKLTEGTAATVSSANPFRFLTLPVFECDEQGVRNAYSMACPFIKDGLMFYLKGGHYNLGLTPLVLVWKDAVTSRYYTYTEKPNIVLRLDAEGQFTTLEGITLSSPDAYFLESNELSEGDLAKFSFDQGYFGDDQKPYLTGLEYIKRCSPQRALADSWTKILFQFNARSGGVGIDHILEVARSAPIEESSMAT